MNCAFADERFVKHAFVVYKQVLLIKDWGGICYEKVLILTIYF